MTLSLSVSNIRRHFVICFFVVILFLNKLSLGKKFIFKVERLNVKQHRSRWDCSWWAVSSGSMLFAQAYIIFWGCERIKALSDWQCTLPFWKNHMWTVIQCVAAADSIARLQGVERVFLVIQCSMILVVSSWGVNIRWAGLGGSIGCASDWRPGGCGFDPRRGRQHSFVEIDHEIFSTVILSLPLIQEGQLSVSGERMCTILVNRVVD